MILNSKTKKDIQEFVSNVSSYSLVEGIYYLCYPDKNDVSIDVIAITNNSLSYNARIGSDHQLSANAKFQLDELLLEYNENFVPEGNQYIRFYRDDSDNYDNFLTNYRTVYAMKRLVGGYVLFDRFDNISKVRENAINNGVGAFSHTFTVEDAEDLQTLVLEK